MLSDFFIIGNRLIQSQGSFMISHLQLTNIETLSSSCSLNKDHTGYQFLIINHPKVAAAFALHGGHLIHFQIKDKPATIWTSKTAIFNDEKAIRGGVPICWPWFGAADAELGNNLPAHGLARTSNNWSIGDISESDEGVDIKLHLTSSPETKALWPFDFNLTLQATLSSTLSLKLITENTGNLPFNYRAALHSYINLSDVTNVQISDLAEHSFNSLTQKTENKDGNLIINQAIDSIYDKAPQDIQLKDTGFDHTINIHNEGNDSEILWSPWVAGAEAFADMPDDGFKTMFCIESGITKEKGVTVLPNDEHILATQFSIK